MRTEHFSYLDGWRGLAICLLLLGHFFPVPGINFGAVGVSFFFVLSGLFMSRLLFIQETPLDAFYKRRVARIFPAAGVFILAILLLYSVFDRPVSWSETAAAALFINNYFTGEAGNAVMPFGHIWSLSVEEHSYILLALLAIVVRTKRANAVAVTGLAAAGCAAATLYYFARAESGSLWAVRTEVAGYGIFLSAALTVYFHGRRLPGIPWFVYPALVAVGIALHWWSVPAPVRIIFGIGAFALAVNLLAAAPPVVKSVLSARVLQRLGILSFSIYLWQQPFYLLVHREGLNPVLALCLALGAGIASFHCIENPARQFLNSRWSKPRSRQNDAPGLSPGVQEGPL